MNEKQVTKSRYSFYTSGAPRHPKEPTWKYHWRRLFTIKTLESLESDQEHSKLKKALTAFDLTMIGIGNVIGAGIFVLTGVAAATSAGPAIVISFIISGIAAAFAALSYSELASMIPVSGSAYTYTYATMGEVMAWIIGWDLILEYLVGAASVAVDAFHVDFSESWTKSPVSFNTDTQSFERVPGAYFNLPAFTISIIVTFLLIFGIKESARVNAIIVSVKIFIIVLFVLAASTKIDPDNYKPFVPKNEGSFSKFGVSGIFSAASVVFFSYIGFDSVSTTSQEVRNPQRDLPIGIIGSLGISTVLYIAVCLVLTGIVPYTKLDDPAPIGLAVRDVGLRWLEIIVDIGALAGLSSVILTSLMGQPRIFYSMASDGLFPKFAAKIHPKYRTPYITTALTGTICAIASAILPIDVLAELTSVGTLLAFFLVNIGVLILRKTAPDAPRKFKAPGGPYFVPITGALLSLLLLVTATKASIERLFIWMAIGLIIYAFYGRTHSKVNNPSVIETIDGSQEKAIDSSNVNIEEVKVSDTNVEIIEKDIES